MSDEFIGPQQKSPFDELSKEQLANFDKALAMADGIKLYHSAGGIGVAANWAPQAEQLARRGGLTEHEAMTLARYRMWKQGMPVIPSQPTQKLTPEQVNQRGAAFAKATPEERSRMMDDDKAAIYNGQQDYFSSLVKPKKPELEQESEEK